MDMNLRIVAVPHEFRQLGCRKTEFNPGRPELIKRDMRSYLLVPDFPTTISGSKFKSESRFIKTSGLRNGVISGVRVLVGTAKGAFILSADGNREKWDIAGPFFAGWTVYHLKGSPIDPNRIYASQSSDWFGQVIQRSSDGGKTWEQPGGEPAPDFTGAPPGVSNKFVYEGNAGTHLWYDGTPHPFEFKRVWHLEPSLTDVDTVYAGVEDAAIFRTTNGLPQKDCYVNVLRDAMATDSLDSCGIYLGTTGGQVYVSPDGGDHWTTIVHDLPRVLSVEVQTLP